MSLDQLKVMATAIKNKNSPVENVWGFMTLSMELCVQYASQHKINELFTTVTKRDHDLIFQSIMAQMESSPFLGRQHDAGLLRGSTPKHGYTCIPNNEVYCIWRSCISFNPVHHSTIKVQLYQLTKLYLTSAC